MKNTDFRTDLNRKELIAKAVEFGQKQTSAMKSNTRKLETFVARRLSSIVPMSNMSQVVKRPIKQESDFTFGINRKKLQDMVTVLGEKSPQFRMKPETIAKASTKTLEQFLQKAVLSPQAAKIRKDSDLTRKQKKELLDQLKVPPQLTDKQKTSLREQATYFPKNSNNKNKPLNHLIYTINKGSVKNGGATTDWEMYLKLSVDESSRIHLGINLAPDELDDIVNLLKSAHVSISEIIKEGGSFRKIVTDYMDNKNKPTTAQNGTEPARPTV